MKKSPFKFLDYFEDKEEDHESFFGREPEIERLYRLVNHHRLSLIYGPSGTGKTSLINCGLAKQFYATDWLPLYIKRQGNINDSLLNALKGRLQEEEKQLADSEDVVKLIEELSIQHLCPVYLIFDQLEELYIYGGEEEQLRFTDQVKRIVDAGLPCRIILVLREEYLGRLYAFEQQVPISYEKRLRIEPLTAPIVKQEVIAKSFVLFNISLSEPGLMDRMLKNLTGLKQVIPLPYLQVYLDRLWHAAYQEQVGVVDIEKPALSITPAIVDGLGTLEEVFAAYLMDQRREIQYSLEKRFPACPEDFVRSLLDGLVTPEGTKRSVGIEREGTGFVVKAPVPTGWDKVDSLLLNEGLHALATARLLRVEEESVELAHDSLAAVIDGQRSAEERQLNLYRQQIQGSLKLFSDENKSYLTRHVVNYSEENLAALELPLQQRAYLEDSKAHWQEIDLKELIKEREKRRWFVGFSLVVGVLALAAFGAFLWANKQAEIAIHEKREAENQKKIANNALASLKLRTKEVEKSDSISKVQTKFAEEQTKKAKAERDTSDLRRAELVRELQKARLLEGSIGMSYDELIQEGEKRYGNGGLQNALTFWALAQFTKPGNKDPAELIDLVEFAIEAERLSKEGYWEEALKKYSAIWRSSSHHESPRWVYSAFRNIGLSQVNFEDYLSRHSPLDKDTLKLLDLNITSIPRHNAIDTNVLAIKISENSSLTSLESLRPFRKTQYFDVENSEIYYLNELSNLVNLEVLRLNDCYNISDIRPLSFLSTLRSLELSGCAKIKNFTPLASLDSLKRLTLTESQISDLSPIQNLIKLETLDLSNCPYIKDITAISYLSSLENLNLLNSSRFIDYTPLSTLVKLRNLNLRRSEIEKIDALSSLDSLENLNLSSCVKISDLSPLSGLSKLKSLNLAGCEKIDSITSLSSLIRLETLDLSYCKWVENFDPISSLTGLKSLNLRGCEINTLDFLDNLDSLETLVLGHCKNVADIDPLFSLPSLKYLDIRDCSKIVIDQVTKLTEKRSGLEIKM